MKDEMEKLESRNALLELILNNNDSYIFTKDTKGCYTYVNDLVVELFERKKEDIIGPRAKNAKPWKRTKNSL